MTTATATQITLKEFLALPDDGIYREVIRGKLREYSGARAIEMTRRSRLHAGTESCIVFVLKNWLHQRPEQSGGVFSGEVGCILTHDPLSAVGVDVAYVSQEVLDAADTETTMIDGAPILAVEILSRSDTVESINEKIDDYLAAGVKIIWVVDPHFETVKVHRCDRAPEMFNNEEELTAEPFLPGFRTPVAALFA